MKKLVIIGGGFAGALIAKKLQKRFSLTLIDSKDYFEFTPGILRAIVSLDHLKEVEVRHKDYLKSAEVIRSSVSKIKENKVLLSNGKKVPFDYLVIASGSGYLSPIKSEKIVIANRGRNLAKYHSRLEKASKVCIMGAGPVGVELAGEIIDAYPNKQLILINSQKEILGRNNSKARGYATKFLEKRGVKIVSGERAISHNGKHVKTDRGSSFLSDLCILCTGIKPNSEFLDKKFLDKKKFILVDEFLQLQGKPKIFVCGDVSSVYEEKTAQAAEKQAGIVIRNILALENKRKLTKYKPRRRPMIISLGKRNGILEWKNFIITGRITSLLKDLVEKKTMLKYKKLF